MGVWAREGLHRARHADPGSMTQFVDTETGEVYEGPCPACAHVEDEAAIQVRAMELELQKMRSKVTHMERQADRDAVAKRDGATWKRLLNAWLEAFPNKRPTAKGAKSARATHAFLRLESGATIEDFEDAIRGAKEFPFVTFGKRTKTGAAGDRKDDLQDIAAVKNDAMFDWLRDAGRAARENDAPF